MNLVLLDLQPKLISKLEGKHQVFAVLYRIHTPLESRTCFDLYDLVLGEGVGLGVLGEIDFIILVFSLLKHRFFLSVLLLITDEGLLGSLSPDSNRFVSADSDEEVTDTRDSQTPHFCKKGVENEDFIVGVSIHHLNLMVLGGRENVVRVFNEPDLRDAVLMDEHRLMDVTELHAPYLEVLVS